LRISTACFLFSQIVHNNIVHILRSKLYYLKLQKMHMPFTNIWLY